MRYTKNRLVKSVRYAKYRDILEVTLEEDKIYSSEEVENIIKEFPKKSEKKVSKPKEVKKPKEVEKPKEMELEKEEV